MTILSCITLCIGIDMKTFSISKWFHVEAENSEEAWAIAVEIGEVVEEFGSYLCTDSGDIDVEEVEE